MTRNEFLNGCVKGMAKVLNEVRAQPGITKRELLKRSNKRHVCLAFLHLACTQRLIIEVRGLFADRYYPEEYGPWL